MLKISEMAKLANTTRRTLIFYDEQSVFQPAQKSKSGYRYYDYSQLYDLMNILGLRNLGLSLEEIKEIRSKSEPPSSTDLLQTRSKIDAKIKELEHIQAVVDQRMKQAEVVDNPHLYQPDVVKAVKTIFWCSAKSVTCTEEEVAQLFSDFYKQLDTLAVMNTGTSGFLTDLSVDHPSDYATASFRIIKEIMPQNLKVPTPLIEKSAGNYVRILVENNAIGINHGLTVLKSFCQQNHLITQDHLWQINYGDTLIETGASKYGWLEYAVLDS